MEGHKSCLRSHTTNFRKNAVTMKGINRDWSRNTHADIAITVISRSRRRMVLLALSLLTIRYIASFRSREVNCQLEMSFQLHSPAATGPVACEPQPTSALPVVDTGGGRRATAARVCFVRWHLSYCFYRSSRARTVITVTYPWRIAARRLVGETAHIGEYATRRRGGLNAGAGAGCCAR